MSTPTTPYLEAIEHLPGGATLVIHQVSWDDYERLLQDLFDRPHLRISYDRGKLEIMSPSPEHEEYAEFIDDLVLLFSETLDVRLENRHRLSLPPDVCRGDGGRALSQGWTAPSPVGLPPHQQAGCFLGLQHED